VGGVGGGVMVMGHSPSDDCRPVRSPYENAALHLAAPDVRIRIGALRNWIFADRNGHSLRISSMVDCIPLIHFERNRQEFSRLGTSNSIGISLQHILCAMKTVDEGKGSPNGIGGFPPQPALGRQSQKNRKLKLVIRQKICRRVSPRGSTCRRQGYIWVRNKCSGCTAL